MIAELNDNPEKSRGELKTIATKKAMVDAARELFAQKGMDLTTIDEITEHADVAKGTFYYHFKNKNGLVRLLMEQTLAELTLAIEQRCANITELPEMLDGLIVAHIDFFRTRWEDFVLYFQGKADLTLAEGYEDINEPFTDYLDHIAALIDGIVKHKLSEKTLTRISCAVAGFVSGYFSFAVIAAEEDELDKILHPVRSALVGGLTRFIREAIPHDDDTSVRW